METNKVECDTESSSNESMESSLKLSPTLVEAGLHQLQSQSNQEIVDDSSNAMVTSTDSKDDKAIPLVNDSPLSESEASRQLLTSKEVVKAKDRTDEIKEEFPNDNQQPCCSKSLSKNDNEGKPKCTAAIPGPNLFTLVQISMTATNGINDCMINFGGFLLNQIQNGSSGNNILLHPINVIVLEFYRDQLLYMIRDNQIDLNIHFQVPLAIEEIDNLITSYKGNDISSTSVLLLSISKDFADSLFRILSRYSGRIPNGHYQFATLLSGHVDLFTRITMDLYYNDINGLMLSYDELGTLVNAQKFLSDLIAELRELNGTIAINELQRVLDNIDQFLNAYENGVVPIIEEEDEIEEEQHVEMEGVENDEGVENMEENNDVIDIEREIHSFDSGLWMEIE